MSETNPERKTLTAAEAVEKIAAALMLDHDFVPLEKIWPEQSSLSARFDACLAKRDGADFWVKAILADRGLGGEELKLSAEIFREALKKAEAPVSGSRVLAELILVSPVRIAEERWTGLISAPEGSFLSPVLVSKSCVELSPRRFRHEGRVKLWPGARWYLNTLKPGRPLESREMEETLEQRWDQDQKTRRLLHAGNPWATYGLILLNLAAFSLIWQQAEIGRAHV
jgi:hypothetical protein